MPTTSNSLPTTAFRRGGWKLVAGLMLALTLLLSATIWYKLFRRVPQHFANDEEAFKYRSIGTEEAQGMPYWIWVSLPRLFPEYLPAPGGYASLGVLWEQGHETPVGFSKLTIGYERIGITCALCHTGSYRTTKDEVTHIVPTAPAQRLQVQAYQRFVFACASDARFNATNLMAEINESVPLSFCDRLLYRFLLIPATRKALLKQKQQYEWMDSRPAWLCGRIDPFNPVKFAVLDIDPQTDRTIGNSDMEPIWNMAAHEGFALHWDGLNSSLTEVVQSGAIGDGATHKSLPVEYLKRLEEWIRQVAPPAYPFPESVDKSLVAEGQVVFDNSCSECHAFGGKRTGTVIPLAEIGTDAHRLDMWTAEAADTYNRYADGYPWDFKDFRKTDGYASVPLDGLWLRAPYLHNGSVPTLEALLEPAAKRPKTFYRGYDVYSRDAVGFVHMGPDAESGGQRFDTSVEGNSNLGHEGPGYGTDLTAKEKRALIEYLKTL